MDLFLNNLIMGTFTHRTTYLPRLLESVKKFHPSIPFIIQIDDKPIAFNFHELKKKFESTGKRFWLFLDDDIEFIDSVTIPNALKTMFKDNYSLVTCYSTFDPDYKFDIELEEKEIGWAIGYFQLADSFKIGHITSDLNLPFPNSSVDTTYSVTVKSLGYKIGITNGIVYHAYKKYTWTHDDPKVINDYHWKRWGQFYFDCTASVGFRNIVGKIPDTTIDINECIISVDDSELLRNRTRLINWQNNRYYISNDEKIKLNIGSGKTNWTNYIRCDIDENADIKCDMRYLPFKDNSIDIISSHHALEHIPYRHIWRTLKEWHRILKVGGELDLGMPDIELLCKKFLLADEVQKWRWFIHCFYGQQGHTYDHPWNLTENDELDYSQFHMGMLSRKRLEWLLEQIGFEIVDLYNYDGMDTPSVFVLGRKSRVT